jgi:xylulokinase
MAADLLLAHDVGTSGDKAVLLHPDGSVVASAYQAYPTFYPGPLLAEQEPDDLWRAVIATTRQVLETAQADRSKIAGISFSSQMVNAILVDDGGKSLGRSISWLDGRAVDEAQLVMRRLGGPALFARLVGVALTGKDLLPKLLWLKRHEPQRYAAAAAIIDVGSYILLKATGRLVFDWTSASVTGLFNMKSKQWDSMLMRIFGIDADKYPELVPSSDKVGGLTAEAAELMGLLGGTPVIAGAGDAMSVAVGSGAVADGDAHLCLGTSGFIGVMTNRRVTGRRGLVTLQAADDQMYLLIGESETCGGCLKWAARAFYGGAPEEEIYPVMDQEVSESQPGSGNLLFAPWLYGERSPIADERARAAFINLNASHSRPQMMRSIYEGIAFNLRWIIENMQELYGFHPEHMRAVGGGARGLPFLQTVADICGMRLEVVPHPQQAAAVGAGLIAAVGLGLIPSFQAIAALIQPQRIIEPISSPEIYVHLYRNFRQLYPRLRDLFHRLNIGETRAAG